MTVNKNFDIISRIVQEELQKPNILLEKSTRIFNILKLCKKHHE